MRRSACCLIHKATRCVSCMHACCNSMAIWEHFICSSCVPRWPSYMHTCPVTWNLTTCKVAAQHQLAWRWWLQCMQYDCDGVVLDYMPEWLLRLVNNAYWAYCRAWQSHQVHVTSAHAHLQGKPSLANQPELCNLNFVHLCWFCDVQLAGTACCHHHETGKGRASTVRHRLFFNDQKLSAMDSIGWSYCHTASWYHKAAVHTCLCLQETAHEGEEGAAAGHMQWAP